MATQTDKKNKVGDKTDQPKKKTPVWLTDIRYGRSLSVDFFRKNAWLLILLLVIVIALMGLRYKTKTKMAEIKHLQKELREAESEKLREKAEYMSLIRETEMQRLVNEKGLGLQFQDQPPYTVPQIKE
ncbi:MAG: hypothetical protein K2N03_01320 [Muribaculaceae bacterium]|nr:hypothetical protein [Muribaculaceae bacterium]